MATKAPDRDAPKGDEKIARTVAPEDASLEKHQPRQQQGRLPSLNLILSFAGVVAVGASVWVAKNTLDSINKSVDVAVDQLKLSREQFTDTRDARRREQRAWLGYAGFTMQSQKNTGSDRWEDKDISDPDDIYRFKVSVVNKGRTPALNVTLTTGCGTVALPNRIAPIPDEWRTSTELQRGVVVMPGEQGRYLYTPALSVHSGLFRGYMSESGRIFLWTQLQYCDVYQRRHWALIAVARQAGSNPDSHFTIAEQRFGPADGEPNHPCCQDIVLDTP